MKRFLAIGLILVGANILAQEQKSTEKKILTFEDAIKIALKNGLLLNQQKNNMEYSQVQKTQSIVAAGPNVTINSSASQINGNSFNPNTGSVINGVRDNMTASINANINLFSGFNRINSIRQYSSFLEAQVFYVNRTQQDLINAVANQYLQVLLDVELAKIANENFVALDKQYQQTKEQVSLGARSPVDEYNQLALAKAAELRYVQAEITVTNDKTLLTQTLIIDPFEEYEVEKPNWDVNKIGADVLNLEELAAKAKSVRGDYLRAVKQENGYRFSTAAARANMAPTLFAFGSYGSAYNFQHGVQSTIPQTTGVNVIADPSSPSGYSLQDVTSVIPNPNIPRPFSEQFKVNNVSKQYGLQLQIPIFNGLQNRTTTKQQSVLYENAILTRKSLEMQIKNEVIRAAKTFEGAKKSYSVSLDQYNAADLALRYETERYNLGVTSFVDYANANRVFVQAQTDRAQAEYRLLFQKVLVDYAVGTLRPEDLQ